MKSSHDETGLFEFGFAISALRETIIGGNPINMFVILYEIRILSESSPDVTKIIIDTKAR